MEYRGYCIPDSLQFAEAIDEIEEEQKPKKRGRLRKAAKIVGAVGAIGYGGRLASAKRARNAFKARDVKRYMKAVGTTARNDLRSAKYLLSGKQRKKSPNG